ncbi:hypothetical protein [Bacillus sp. 166amftsu]|uniref:hypothetical protein n=1 Tax=Bacillus sp. 166amftsu TaxID=1761753 RepID=UPI0008958444|nr:hypothetical protein [Bacillus sp. 166amftsu]SDZ46360.1 hypothetical protein SAMN04488156_1592 [Bacillus sp. 166amftsu]
MKKSIEKLVKSITESTSITDIYDNQICNTLSPVIDFFIFPEYLIFNATTYSSKIVSLLIFLAIIVVFGLLFEFILKKAFKQGTLLELTIKIFGKIMTIAILFYGIKIVIYLIRLKKY